MEYSFISVPPEPLPPAYSKSVDHLQVIKLALLQKRLSFLAKLLNSVVVVLRSPALSLLLFDFCPVLG
jgi:hypothetical protein